MKYSFFIAFLLVGLCHGFFGSIGQAINNAGNTGSQIVDAANNATNGVSQIVEGAVTDGKHQLENVVGQILNIANGIQFAAQFLWTSVFSPAFDMTIEGRVSESAHPKGSRPFS